MMVGHLLGRHIARATQGEEGCEVSEIIICVGFRWPPVQFPENINAK